MIVEVTEESELKELLSVLLEFYEVMPYTQLKKGSKEHEDASDAWIETWYFMIQAKSASILALKKEGKFIGAIGLTFSSSLEDGVFTCMEAFWFVSEEHRGQGLKLLLKAEKVAKQRGAKRMMMVYLENSMPQKVKLVYDRMKYKKIQTIYFKEL